MAVLKYRDPGTGDWVPLPNIAGPTGPTGPAGGGTGTVGPTGPTGPAGPNAVSSDAGNTAATGTDGLIFVPDSSADYVNVTGDTMTGDLLVSKASARIQASATSGVAQLIANSATGGSNVEVRSPSGQSAQLLFRTDSSLRWNIYKTNSPETGADTGSVLNVAYYDDAGAYKGTAASFNRSTGLGTVAGDPTDALGIATKQYVDRDTGWRNITSLATNGWVGSSGIAPPHIRRVGSQVHFTGGFIRSTYTEGTVVASLAGFNMETVGGGAFCQVWDVSTNSFLSDLMGYSDATAVLGFYGLGGQDNKTMLVSFSWVTSDPWPSTLPGTPGTMMEGSGFRNSP